jgi:DNA-directed RNA polymerase subunit beta'
LIPAGTGMRAYNDIIVGSQEEYDSLVTKNEGVVEKEAAQIAE